MPIQDLRKSVIITSKDKDSIERKNKTSMRLKKILYSFLRGKPIRIRDSDMSSGKSLVLSSLIRHKPTVNLKEKVLRIIFFSNQKLFGKLCY